MLYCKIISDSDNIKTCKFSIKIRETVRKVSNIAWSYISIKILMEKSLQFRLVNNSVQKTKPKAKIASSHFLIPSYGSRTQIITSNIHA